MFRGGSIIATFALSICFLKMKVRMNHILGSGLALAGMIVVGASGLLFAEDNSSSGTAVCMNLCRDNRSWAMF